MRVVAADPPPFAQLAGWRSCSPPIRSRSTLHSPSFAASRRVEMPLRQHLEELYDRCARLPPARRRRAVHLAARRERSGPQGLSLPELRRFGGRTAGTVAPIDDADLAKLGIDRAVELESALPVGDPAADVEDDLPRRPLG
jgi:hypothetical protein